MTNNARQLVRTLRRSAENSGNNANDSFLSTVQGDINRISSELQKHGQAIVQDSSGRSYRIERVSGEVLLGK